MRGKTQHFSMSSKVVFQQGNLLRGVTGGGDGRSSEVFETILKHMMMMGGLNNDAPPSSSSTEKQQSQQHYIHIEKIVSTGGHTTAADEWYDQEQHEWVVLLQGEAKLLLDFSNTIGEEKESCVVVLHAMDYVLIPARLRHRVTYTSSEPPTVWLAVHFQ